MRRAQESLKRALRAADPSPGGLVKNTLKNLVQRPGGTGKEFGIKISRHSAEVDPADSEVEPVDLDAEESPF
ncbi:hypothetical protein [Mycolicibacterium sp.]|uniref:hypothetical protein n=1 Tax=Mycolicibacterium sp. TaxID=2320850 RepID=UPI003D11000D